MVAIAQTKYTVDGLRYTRGAVGGMDIDYEKMYADQDAVYDLLRENGFEVRMRPGTAVYTGYQHVRGNQTEDRGDQALYRKTSCYRMGTDKTTRSVTS